MQIVVRQQNQELERVRRRVQSRAKQVLARQVKAMVYDMHFFLLSRTPVYSGYAIANIQWSMDRPAPGAVSANLSGPTGKTSQMALGPEPRRDANESIATGSLLALDFSDPFRRIYVTNNAPYFDMVEEGTYGEVTGTAERTPEGGIFRAAADYIRARHGGVRLRGTF